VEGVCASTVYKSIIHSNYISNTGTCSVHFIREVVLYALVLEHVPSVIRYVRQFEKVFIKQVSLKSAEE
jgi:site-specific DNA recombinase